jgi:hypothetical protein
MSNLVLALPPDTYSATLFANTAADASYPVTNLSLTPRHLHYKASANVTVSQFDYDFGSAITPDFLIIARADLLKRSDSGNPAIDLIGSASSGFGSPDTYSSTITNATLYGSANEDWIYLPTVTTPRRYWRVKITTTSSFKHRFSKLYLGSALDLGRDPVFPRRLSRQAASLRDRAAANTCYFEWRGIPDATRYNFNTLLGKYFDVNPIFLFTRTFHDTINELRVLHCRIVAMENITKVRGTNHMRLTFEEVI